MIIGNEEKLYIKNSIRKYDCSSSNSGVVSVKDDKVRAKAIVKAKIVAQNDDESYICHISVTASVTHITISNWESQYYMGEEALHIDHTVLDVTYHDGARHHVKLTENMCSEYNLQKDGKQSVKISYQGYDLRKEINVEAFQFLRSPIGDFSLQLGESKTISLNIP